MQLLLKFEFPECVCLTDPHLSLPSDSRCQTCPRRRRFGQFLQSLSCQLAVCCGYNHACHCWWVRVQKGLQTHNTSFPGRNLAADMSVVSSPVDSAGTWLEYSFAPLKHKASNLKSAFKISWLWYLPWHHSSLHLSAQINKGQLQKENSEKMKASGILLKRVEFLGYVTSLRKEIIWEKYFEREVPQKKCSHEAKKKKKKEKNGEKLLAERDRQRERGEERSGHSLTITVFPSWLKLKLHFWGLWRYCFLNFYWDSFLLGIYKVRRHGKSVLNSSQRLD